MPTNESAFKKYLRKEYGSIGGTALRIERIYMGDDTVTIGVDEKSAVFFVRNKYDAKDYTEKLLDDAVLYFGAGVDSVLVGVNHLFHVKDLKDEYFGDFYFVGDHSPGIGWLVIWRLATGYDSLDGYRPIEIWEP